jgi:protein-disulfide isomerase/uncharacterized membrane protein
MTPEMARPSVHPAVILLRLTALGALTFSVATAVAYYGPGSELCQPGGGCDQVRSSAVGRSIGDLLPVVGILAYSAIFAGALIERRPTLRLFAGFAALGGVGAAAFLGLQATVIGAWCWLCVGVDAFGLLAAGAGVWVLVSGTGDPEGSVSFMSPWWGLWWLAWAPVAWAATFPDPGVPPAIRELYDPSADVNVVEMADFECPFCRRMNPVLESVLEETDGRVHLVRLMVPLELHRHARGAAAAYFCAQRQGRGEAMASRLFEAEDIGRAGLLARAEALGLDEEAFEACLDDPAIDARIEADIERARRAGMRGLPTVYIGDRTVIGFAPGYETQYREAIAAARHGEGERVRLWPSAVLLLLAVLSAAVGGRVWKRRR